MEYNTSKIINVARWTARVIALVYTLCLLYSWFMGAYVLSQAFSGMHWGIYLVTFLSLNALMIAYVLLIWREVLASWMAGVSAAVLVVLDVPVAGDLRDIIDTLTMNLPGNTLKLIILLLPVIILHFCRRASRLVVE